MLFAVDSIPAVLAVSDDPFVVYTSNIAAVVGLRSLYQLLSVAVSDLIYLEKAVALVLGFVGLKLGLEVGGRWSEEAWRFVRLLARAKARASPPLLRRAAQAAWRRRWVETLAVAAQRAPADSLLELPAVAGAWVWSMVVGVAGGVIWGDDGGGGGGWCAPTGLVAD